MRWNPFTAVVDRPRETNRRTRLWVVVSVEDVRIALAKRKTEGRRYCGAAGGKVGGGLFRVAIIAKTEIFPQRVSNFIQTRIPVKPSVRPSHRSTESGNDPCQ